MTITEGVKIMTLMPYRVMLYRPGKKRIYCYGKGRLDEFGGSYYAVTLDDLNGMKPAISDSPLLFSPLAIACERCELVFPPPEFISDLPTYFQANSGYPDLDREDVKELFGEPISDVSEAEKMFRRILLGVADEA